MERNDGSAEKPYFMSRDLKKVLGYIEDEEEEEGSQQGSPRKD